MPEILTPVDGDKNPFTAPAHPVVRVYCDGEGIVCYERDGAAPIRLNEVSPRRSRDTAKERLFALLDMVEENSIERDFPVSRTGKGLTYNQLKMQTVQACLKSKDLEAKRKDEFTKKRKR